MTFAVFIPSMSRAKAQLVQSGPYPHLHAAGVHHVAYVVPPAQLADYVALGLPVVPHPEECRGIAKVRRWIGEYAKAYGIEKFLMLDDDVSFFTRRADDDTRLRKSEPSDVAEMVQAVRDALNSYGHVGISARGGNNNAGTGAKPLAKDNTRTIRALAYRTEDFLSVEHGRVVVMEDFDVNLQLLRKGIPNTCLHYWATDQAGTQQPGGCSDYRNHQNHEESAHMLAELHHPFVRTRLKKNKTGGEFGTRTEVTIYWKKAYESSGKEPVATVPAAAPKLPPMPPK